MKLMDRMQLWDLQRDLKHAEGKVKFLKEVIKHFKEMKGGNDRKHGN